MSHAHAAAHDHDPAHADDASWDDMAPWYAELVDRLEPELGRVSEDLLDAVRAGPGTRILDLACGPGHLTAAADARGADALGIDLSPAMVDAARQRFPDARFAVGDMLDPPPGPWDAVVCRFGAHHADDAWMAAALRVLRPGGRVALAEWGPDDAGPDGGPSRSPEQWMALLEAAGFVDVACTAIFLRVEALLAEPPDAGEAPVHDGPAYVLHGRRP